MKEFKKDVSAFIEIPTKRNLQKVLFSLIKVCAEYSYEPEVCFLDFLRREFKI